MITKIAAFGALNKESYDEFKAQLEVSAERHNLQYGVVVAKPYPNAKAVSEPGRPLRGEALQDENKKQQLFTAVAEDAKLVGGTTADIRVMPCMSMIGFHEGVEKALGFKILSLADALAEKYSDVDKLGVIHMRPAKKRIEEIFGGKAITPDDVHSAMLLAAEEEAKNLGDVAPVEAVMREIVEAWKGIGIGHVLFARADAPNAIHGTAGTVKGVWIHTYFDILAGATVQAALELQAA